MSTALAQWLSEHQIHLLPRWVAATAAAPASNGQGTDGHSAGLLLEESDTIAQSLQQVYAGLVLAAQGDQSLLNEQLRAVSNIEQQQDVALPEILAIMHKFRRLFWEYLQEEHLSPEQRLTLIAELENLLEHAVDILAQEWTNSANSAIQTRVEEAEFIAQSMNVAIEQVDRTAVQLALVNDISQRLASSLENADSLEIVSFVGDKLIEILDVEHIAIWLPDEAVDPDNNKTILKAVQIWGKAPQPISALHIAATTGNTAEDIVMRAYLESRIIQAYEPLPDIQSQGIWYLDGHGVIALPLLVKDRAIGVIALQDPHLGEQFALMHQDTLRSVMTQVAIALDNVRLYEKVRRFNNDLEQLIEQRTQELQTEKDRLSTLRDIAAEASSTLDMDALLGTSLEALARITGVSYGSIMLFDPETEHLINRAVLGQETVDSFTGFPIGKGVAGWVAQHKQPALIGDVNADSRWVPSMSEDGGRKHNGSMVSVPLIAHDERLGVLTLSHEETNYFNDDHLRLMVASAGAIAIGIHNANLYTDIVSDMERRGELLHRQQMETSQIEAILQSLADGVIVCDPDGGVLSTNQACGEILQRSVEELILSDLHQLLRQLLAKRVDELPLNELLRRPTGVNEQPRIFESTVEIGMRVVSLTLGPVLKEDGELVGALLVLHDKTREVESERLKTEFIGTMSHELRTPMTSIKGFTQLLAIGGLGPINDTQREFLNTIQSNAERMISIINDVLELTKIETGSIDLEVRPLHLAEALSGVVTELQSLSDEHEHTMSISIPPGLPLVRADANRLHQVLYNLVSNAIKYTPSGGEVRVNAYEADLNDLPLDVHDSLLTNRRYTRIDIHDTGVGIAEHELNKIFERFYRTENPMKVEAGGTGLGLSLTRPLIELLGGRIWVTSTLGEGSTFSFVLPAVDETRTR